jgi:UDP-sulfoquinovose synthase
MIAGEMDLQVQIDHLPDPRVEAETHYYNAKHSRLSDLGLEPHLLSDALVNSLVNVAVRYRDRIDPGVFAPQVNWRSGRNQRRTVSLMSREMMLSKEPLSSSIS